MVAAEGVRVKKGKGLVLLAIQCKDGRFSSTHYQLRPLLGASPEWRRRILAVMFSDCVAAIESTGVQSGGLTRLVNPGPNGCRRGNRRAARG